MEYKGPSPSVLDFAQDWSSWLATGDSVSISIWTVETGITVDSEALAANIATAVISGGTLGKAYKVSNTITTANGLNTSRVWFLKIQHRLV